MEDFYFTFACPVASSRFAHSDPVAYLQPVAESRKDWTLDGQGRDCSLKSLG